MDITGNPECGISLVGGRISIKRLREFETDRERINIKMLAIKVDALSQVENMVLSYVGDRREVQLIGSMQIIC